MIKQELRKLLAPRSDIHVFHQTGKQCGPCSAARATCFQTIILTSIVGFSIIRSSTYIPAEISHSYRGLPDSARKTGQSDTAVDVLISRILSSWHVPPCEGIFREIAPTISRDTRGRCETSPASSRRTFCYRNRAIFCTRRVRARSARVSAGFLSIGQQACYQCSFAN